jgi:large conductance mechanosensitive channel
MSEYLQIKKPGWLEDFKVFLMRGNVVDLAVGVVIGAAFTGIVGSLVKDIITPFIGLITGGVDFSNLFLTLKGPAEATLADAAKAGAVTVNYGVFLNAVINFLIVSAAIFFIVRLISKLHKAPPAADPGPTPSEALLMEIRDLLKGRDTTAALPEK